MIGLQENQTAPDVVLIEGQARLSAAPAEAHIGEPVVWTLSVQHASGDDLPGVLPEPVSQKDGFVLLEGPVRQRTTQPDGSVLSEVQWTYLSLRPGARTPKDYSLTLKRGAPLSVEVRSLQVLGELEAGEEVPRPMAPIRTIEPSPTGDVGLWLGLGLVVILALLVWRKTGGRKREDQATSAPSIWDALQEATLPADPDAARQTLYDWHHDLRRGVDRALGTDRGACIDAHWIEQTRAAAGARSYPWADLERVLEELERLKYQQPMPGRLTLEGVGERVRSLAAALRMAEQVPSATVAAETTGKSATAREEANV